MIGLLLDLARAFRDLCEVRRIRARWELLRDIQAQADATEDEILRLRAGDAADQLRADRLRLRLEADLGLAARLPADPPAGDRDSGPDQGRPLQPAAGRDLAQSGGVSPSGAGSPDAKPRRPGA